MEINIDRVLNFIRDNSDKYALAKANRVYVDEFRKSKKAMLMKEAEAKGYESAAAQEREAYAAKEYCDILEGLKQAVYEEERLRWLLIAAQARFEAWRSIESSRRAETKIV